MKTVVLCGGLGTRLKEETEFRPKPLVEIGGRPILWHIMKLYAHHGLRDFVLCLGYRGNMIKDYFLNYEAMNSDFTVCLGQKSGIHYHGSHREQDFRVTLADTGQHSMTGGRVKRIQKYVCGTRFLLTYGDGVSDLDLHKLIEFHESHGRLATVTVVHPLSRFGAVQLDGGQRVSKFTEKPRSDGWVSAGFFVFEPGVFDYLTGGDECVLEREPMEKLAAEGELMAYQHDGFFGFMDTYRDFEHLNQLWASEQAPWKVWE